MSKWYNRCVCKLPERRIIIGNSRDGLLVREINPKLEVLYLHDRLQAVSLKENVPSFAGYYCYGNDYWIPLLPGYSIFFNMEKKIWKFSITCDYTYRLKFQWYTYDINSDLEQPLATGFDYCLFKSIRAQYDPHNTRSLPYILGFLEVDNVALLRATIAEQYPSLFPNNQQMIKALEAEDRLRASLKRKSAQLSVELNDVWLSTGIPIKQNMFLEKKGKTLPTEDIQTLMLKYKESQIKIQNLCRKITRLEKRIEELESRLEEETENLDEADLLETTIKNAMESAQLGSMILISTKQYLSLVLTQPCSNCNNNSITNKIWNITSIGFQIKNILECKICSTIFEHTNETQEIQLAKAIAAAGLAGGISHNAIQSSLATIGITNQICNKTYYRYQKMYFTPIIDGANSSVGKTLQKCIDHTLSQGKDALAVGFDCSWSHVRNASQASGELIYQEIPPGIIIYL